MYVKHEVWAFLHKSIHLSTMIGHPMTLRRQVDFGRLMMNIRAEEQKADLEKNTTEITVDVSHANNSKKKMGVKGAKGKVCFFS